MSRYLLVRGLAQVLLGSVKLGLEQVHLALQRFRVGGVRLVLLTRRLVLVQLALELVQVTLGDAQLVLQRRDLLILGEQLLLQLLVLGCQLIGALTCCVGLYAERVKFLVGWSKARGLNAKWSVCLYSWRAPPIAHDVIGSADAYLLDAVLLWDSAKQSQTVGWFRVAADGRVGAAVREIG